MILLLLVVAGVAWFVTTPAERERAARLAIAAWREVREAARRPRPELERFRDALRQRTRFLVATPLLVAVNIIVFLRMAFGAGALSDPLTIVGWGGNFGLRTTNGEWWRLATSMFVHSGLLQVMVNMVALWQIGSILERLVGRPTFVAAYLGAGVFAGLVGLSTSPVAVSAGASGAIFGLYGLMVPAAAWSAFSRSAVSVPLIALRRLLPAAGLFVCYNLANGGLSGRAEIAGLLIGSIIGAVLTKGISLDLPPLSRVTAATATTLVIAIAAAVPLRGFTDVRPEIEGVLALEERTAGDYRAAIDRLKKRQMTSEQVVQLIDRSIVPQLEAAGGRLKALERVPPEHRALVGDTEEYLRLRSESWRLRADGLGRANDGSRRQTKRNEWESDSAWRVRAQTEYRAKMVTLGKAEQAERASLEKLESIRPALLSATLDQATP